MTPVADRSFLGPNRWDHKAKKVFWSHKKGFQRLAPTQKIYPSQADFFRSSVQQDFSVQSADGNFIQQKGFFYRVQKLLPILHRIFRRLAQRKKIVSLKGFFLEGQRATFATQQEFSALRAEGKNLCLSNVFGASCYRKFPSKK